jgi:hypothetical protein
MRLTRFGGKGTACPIRWSGRMHKVAQTTPFVFVWSHGRLAQQDLSPYSDTQLGSPKDAWSTYTHKCHGPGDARAYCLKSPIVWICIASPRVASLCAIVSFRISPPQRDDRNAPDRIAETRHNETLHDRRHDIRGSALHVLSRTFFFCCRPGSVWTRTWSSGQTHDTTIKHTV